MLGLTATFFIAGGAVDRGIMWNDLVIEAMRRAPAALDCGSIGGEAVPLPDARGTRRRHCPYPGLDEVPSAG